VHHCEQGKETGEGVILNENLGDHGVAVHDVGREQTSKKGGATGDGVTLVVGPAEPGKKVIRHRGARNVRSWACLLVDWGHG